MPVEKLTEPEWLSCRPQKDSWRACLPSTSSGFDVGSRWNEFNYWLVDYITYSVACIVYVSETRLIEAAGNQATWISVCLLCMSTFLLMAWKTIGLWPQNIFLWQTSLRFQLPSVRWYIRKVSHQELCENTFELLPTNWTIVHLVLYNKHIHIPAKIRSNLELIYCVLTEINKKGA